jgi:hypothetical protein
MDECLKPKLVSQLMDARAKMKGLGPSAGGGPSWLLQPGLRMVWDRLFA